MAQKLNLDGMSIDEMWQLHEEISQILSVRLTTEKRELEKRLAQLRRENGMRQSKPEDTRPVESLPRDRRKYPRVLPKYRNPKDRSETWAGRGATPRWLRAELKKGRKLESFAIKRGRPKSAA